MADQLSFMSNKITMTLLACYFEIIASFMISLFLIIGIEVFPAPFEGFILMKIVYACLYIKIVHH